MKKTDVLWRLFQKCSKDIPIEKQVLTFSEVFKHGGYEALAKYVIQNLWVYSIPEDEDTMYLRGMMVSLWENGHWPKDSEELCHTITH